MPLTFKHSGDLGDIIAFLPTIKALGGGSLALSDRHVARAILDPLRKASIRPLLESQEYITGVTDWKGEQVDIDGDNFRRFYSGRENLAKAQAKAAGLPTIIADEPWLSIEPRAISEIVFARSSRYHNDGFPWPSLIHEYSESDPVFVGLAGEWGEFKFTFRDVPGIKRVKYHATVDLLEVGQIIRGSKLFVGNQSAPLWIANGLHHPTLLETYCGNSSFDDRSNQWCFGRPSWARKDKRNG